MRPVGIDLFAGAGGMSLGFEQAGFDVVAAVEIDPVHSATHKFNFPDCTVIPKSVVGLSGDEIRELAGIGQRSVHVVFGGAPCQGFSLIGQRVLDDPRNRLVRDFLRLVFELEARYFVFENVKGLTLGKHRAFLAEFISVARENGYEVQSPWRVLDAANFGTPQHRERLILLGARKGFPLPVYPSCVCSAADGRGARIMGLPVGPTVRDAIADLPNADDYEALLTSDEVDSADWGTPSEYGRALRCMTNDAWHFGYVRSWQPGRLTSSTRTTHTEISRRRFRETSPGDVEPISRFYKLPPDGLSNTLRAGTDGARGAFTSPRPIHYDFARCVTVREMARLHGFPDWFRFHETKWHGARQIGNSVPPPLARAVARGIFQVLGLRPETPFALVELGDPKLLRFTVSEAARYFGIPAPAAKRDKKSGAVKRRQIDIEAARLARSFLIAAE